MGFYKKLNPYRVEFFYVPGSSAAIELLLRRTLVRSEQLSTLSCKLQV
jgi:hypothetical protein